MVGNEYMLYGPQTVASWVTLADVLFLQAGVKVTRVDL